MSHAAEYASNTYYQAVFQPRDEGARSICTLCAEWKFLPLKESTHFKRPKGHQTLRRRGQAPKFPLMGELNACTAGLVSLHAEGVVLRSVVDSDPICYINREDIISRVFYYDVVEFLLSYKKRLLLQLEPGDVELLDVLSQAYL